MTSNVIALIPARSGSKGIPNKNIKIINGKPLIAYSIEFALSSKKIDRVIVSTDSQQIADIAKKYGAEVPFLRPSKLATDSAPMYGTVKHLIDFLSKSKCDYKFLALLQPTSPLRLEKDFHIALNTIEKDTTIDSIVSLEELPKHLSPEFLMKIDNGLMYPYLDSAKNIFRRQDVSSAYTRSGQFYISRISSLSDNNTIYGNKSLPYITNHESVNLDTLDDWNLAINLMEKN
ncbi:acylneuraminate cytidylyltransferase family protein [Gammaproteobacteria bacterium]|nr:acylneuraminate cytidylyltransferase family protein [Gammaproteobacteria bacterium]